MTIEQRIKELIKNKGLSMRQFASEIDLPYTTFITMLQNGITKSNISNVNKVLVGLGLSLEDLYDNKLNNKLLKQEHLVNNIPLVGRIAAGTPIFAEENIEDYFSIDASIKADFCLKIRGDSMIDAGIEDGEIVFIKKQDTLENGQIGAILIEDEATLKTFYKDGKTVILQPANTNYSPMVYTGGNIKILGLLVAVLNIRN
mgnify:CR=1 FL=1